jgi:DNA-binding XRE family transcriptional regulator
MPALVLIGHSSDHLRCVLLLLPSLRMHRDRQGYSQAELAKLARLSKATVRKAEAGRKVRGSSGRALASALKVKLEELRAPA